MPYRGADRLVATGIRKTDKAALVTCGVYRAMVRFTGPEVPIEPRSSWATARSVWVPSAKVNGPVIRLNGDLETLRSSVAPSKNCTFVTLAPVPLADVSMLMLSVLPNTEPFGGLV